MRPSHLHRREQGFTLVELAIVLVIIGLLVGGILVAQSMIESARIMAQVRQLQQFDTAVTNFEQRYNSLPGDSATFSADGNGDGILDGASFAAVGWSQVRPDAVNGTMEQPFDGERALFWQQLVQAGLTLSQMSNPDIDASGGIIVNRHIPKSAFSDAGVYATYTSMLFGGNQIWTWVITDNRLTNTDVNFTPTGGAMNATAAGAIDSKIDDGVVYTGKILSTITTNAGFIGKPCTFPEAQLANTRYPCSLFMLMQSQVSQ